MRAPAALLVVVRSVLVQGGVELLHAQARALGNGVRLELSRPGYERTWREPVAIGAPLEIELRSTGWIAGRVLEQDGSSVAGATVA